MKAVILAGGLGTRLTEEIAVRPKPMVEIGGQPILWHILKIYSAHGVNDFVVCCGYRGQIIKEYLGDCALHRQRHSHAKQIGLLSQFEGRTVAYHAVDTGLNTTTGGRLRRAREYGDEPFFMTYGDDVGNVDIGALLAFHQGHGKRATMTAVHPRERFGVFTMSDYSPVVHSFTEKPMASGSWVNGGFFVLEPEILDYIDGDDTVWEQGPMQRLAREGEIVA
jgi:glucose-1-phosphate cytidylyltransferase